MASFSPASKSEPLSQPSLYPHSSPSVLDSKNQTSTKPSKQATPTALQVGLPLNKSKTSSPQSHSHVRLPNQKAASQREQGRKCRVGQVSTIVAIYILSEQTLVVHTLRPARFDKASNESLTFKYYRDTNTLILRPTITCRDDSYATRAILGRK